MRGYDLKEKRLKTPRVINRSYLSGEIKDTYL